MAIVDLFEEDDDVVDQKQRVRNADETRALVDTINKLTKRDFTTMMGSGILVSLTDLEGRAIAPEFCMPAEDMEGIKGAFITSIRAALERRLVRLQSEMRSIEETILPK